TLPPAGFTIFAPFLSGTESLTYIMTKNAFLDAARKYEQTMVKFLRDMIAIPSESAEEGPVIDRIKKEMESTGAFDRVWTDGLGTLLGPGGKTGKDKQLHTH